MKALLAATAGSRRSRRSLTLRPSQANIGNGDDEAVMAERKHKHMTTYGHAERPAPAARIKRMTRGEYRSLGLSLGPDKLAQPRILQ